MSDVQLACDVFRPTYEATDGVDGTVSIEVSPTLGNDTNGTSRRPSGSGTRSTGRT